MKDESDIPTIELHIKELKDTLEVYDREEELIQMEPQTNENVYYLDGCLLTEEEWNCRIWRPISLAPKDKDILIAIKDDEVYIGWHGIKDIWNYSDMNYPGGSNREVKEDKILGWFPIPIPPEEKIM